MGNAQLSLEFVLIFVMAFILFLSLVVVLSNYIDRNNEKLEDNKLEIVAAAIQKELLLSYKSSGYFERIFYVSPKIDGAPYDLYVDMNDTLFTCWNGTKCITPKAIPKIEGNITKGCNKVIKNETKIKVESC